VRNAITTNAQVGVLLMDKEEAHALPDVVGAFWEKYPETVQIYTISDKEGFVYSKELLWWAPCEPFI
jgi:alanyl-tRNA synthetase